jgi:hypothetical protein
MDTLVYDLKFSNKQGLPLKHKGIICPTCKSLLFSRSRHDFSWCRCGDTAVDGGFDYLKMCYKSTPPQTAILFLHGITKEELFYDWNQNIHKHGVYTPEEVKSMQVFAMSSNGKDVLSGTVTKGDCRINLTGTQTPVIPVASVTQPVATTQKKTMKTLLFATAVIVAIGDLRQSKPQGFSIYDITSRLRDQVNNGELSFSDRAVEDVNGQQTYRVGHEKVKALFHDLYNNGVITGLDKEYASSTDGFGYAVFVNRPAAQPTTAAQAASVSPSSAFRLPVTSVPVTQPAKPAATVVPTPVKATAPRQTINNSDVVTKVLNYVNNLRQGEYRTMKQIQSRLKGVSASCQEIADKLASNGVFVEGRNAPVSQWFVKKY